MSKKVQFNKNFWGAVKRKNLLDVLAIVFDESGHEEAGAIARETTRFTNASIERMMNAVGVEQDEAESVDGDNVDEACVETEVADTPEELTYADDTTPARQVEILIEEGDFKKAKKALKKLDEDHPNYKEFKKAIKKGTK